MKLETPTHILRAVYDRELPYRPTWPRDFYAAVNHPVVLVLLETIARQQHTAQDRASSGHKTGRVTPSSLPLALTRSTPRFRPLAPGEIDKRRAASGDRDD